jgi:hypothetical protein
MTEMIDMTGNGDFVPAAPSAQQAASANAPEHPAFAWLRDQNYSMQGMLYSQVVVKVWDAALAATTAQPIADPNAKNNAVQQAQIWAQEARTQRSIVRDILTYFGLPDRDYKALALIKEKIEGAQPIADVSAPTDEQIMLNGLPVENIQLDWVCSLLSSETIFNGADLLQAFNKLVAFYVAARAAAPVSGQAAQPQPAIQTPESRIREIAKTAALAVAKNAGVAEQLCFPHIYLTLKDALAAPAIQAPTKDTDHA